MSPIEEFTESEKQKLNWLQKLAANYPDVTATRLLARGYAKPEIRSVRNIKPSIFRRSMYFLLSLTLVTWLSLLITLGDQRTPLAVYLVFVPFFAFGSVSCMLVVFGKKLNYTIRIDASGLMVQGIFTAWGEIVETAIMRQIRSRGQSRYLVIIKRDGSAGKSDLKLFGISDRKLASAIEYYKAKAGK